MQMYDFFLTNQSNVNKNVIYQSILLIYTLVSV